MTSTPWTSGLALGCRRLRPAIDRKADSMRNVWARARSCLAVRSIDRIVTRAGCHSTLVPCGERMTAKLSLALDHPVVRVVYPEMFQVTFTPDCMAHACRCEDEAGRVLLDACCQHG